MECGLRVLGLQLLFITSVVDEDRHTLGLSQKDRHLKSPKILASLNGVECLPFHEGQLLSSNAHPRIKL